MIEFNLGLVRFSERNVDDWISFQPDFYGEQESGGPPLESAHTYGFLSRPNDPDVDANGTPDEGCSLLYFYFGGEGFAIPTQDPRDHPRLPTLQKGESMQYGSAGQFIRCYADGSISLFTTHDGTPEGRSIYVTLSPDGGLEHSSPWVNLKCGPFGFHVDHSSGASINMGAISAPGIPPELTSYVTLQAATISLVGTVSLGAEAAPGTTNLVAVQALYAFIAELVAAIGTITPTTPGATAMAPILAALPALQTAMADIGKVV